MKILMLAPHPGVRGPVPKHTPILVEGLARAGARVTVLRWGRHSDHETRREKLLGRAADLRAVRRALAAEPYDVLVVKTAHDWNTLARDIPLLVSVRGRVPRTVLQFHGSQPDLLVERPALDPFLLASRRLIRLADGALVLSVEERDLWRKACPGGRFEVARNPYVPLGGGPAPDRSDRANPVFLFVGRLMAAKGVLETLEAFARLRATVPARLVIAGDGPARDAVDRRIASLGLAAHARRTGYLDLAGLAAAYREADVFVLPTYWKEGFPTAITEALQFALPVVTTAIRGAADHLREGENALFVPPRDVDALAAAMERLAADPGLRERMGAANRAKLEDFSGERVARDYLRALERLTGEAGLSPLPSPSEDPSTS